MSRTYVVTGAASGIGRATADLLLGQGATVIGVDLKHTEVTVDLATRAGRGELVDRVRQLTGGRLDALVACAGISQRDPRTVRVNFFGAVATIAGLRPLLAAGTSPAAVVVNSLACVHPAEPAVVAGCLAADEPAAVTAAQAAVDRGEGHLLYTSSKVALARWVRRNAATDDWAGAGIPLNAVAPGIVRTAMTRHLDDDDAAREELDRAVPMPLRGHARPEQIAPLLAWLAGPQNSHVTGQVIFVDGGADAVLRGDSVW
ncbi:MULTISPECIES: SDR family oxidoreductase [unclassified Pseudofrankia]|uniref:SDR family oxidoreductase n=1 Tax=unclassified Pseudofrankia TaxID=2994372 RepID=UPI0008DAD89A|nr:MULTISPECIES: SDR family oxidoreductase [unclassified Pseudofrankia]MDT3443218.1 SDR family oxidoreductase [Pseudofrankia sp. BMG5.37]OHV58975.1 short-chain dehydrogenase [Pseudofrankia sp. BMG5.36]